MTASPRPDVDVVVPVFNEAAGLERSIRRLHGYLRAEFPLSYRITIADNASTDATLSVARRLATELPGVRTVHLPQRGRGRALRSTWLASDATVLAYMDVDLSTGLTALLPLVAPLLSGHSHLGIGTRLARSASVVRGPKRELISRCYNQLLRMTLHVGFSDAQCGFKAVRADVARELLPLVEDQAWFFDTELLVIAERAGLRIHEVPVDWVDDPDSRVAILDTAVKDLAGVWRVGRALATGRLPLDQLRRSFGGPPRARNRGFPELLSFAVIGAVSTAAYVASYAALRTVLPALVANSLALFITTIGNTEANRHWTFGVRGAAGRWRHQLQGMGAFMMALLVSTGALLTFRVTDPAPGRAAEVAVLVSANLVATALRFVLLRRAIGGTARGRRGTGAFVRAEAASSSTMEPARRAPASLRSAS